ncbi:MAG: sigma-70 family RNA polymerase sigma factor [Acidobacteriota bacterium]|nr:sigma-70 family RNA polymerase sigma factor [Acidobacteriota bacterium]
MTNVSHEDIFIQYYSRLRNWAVQITGQDYALAEDLLHDAFIQFTHSQPSLDNIENLDGYLYGIIRNLHLSHLRKASRRNKYRLSIIEFETARLGLRNANAHDNFQIREELKKICYYLCLRKETARAASVMILRFFHGYYPGEIAQILCTTPQAVKVRLRLARIEVKAALENPESTKRVEENLPPGLKSVESFRNDSDLTIALGEIIFSSHTGDCPKDEEVHNLYRETQAQEPVDTATLAHLVSCRKCLDKVNALLGLPPVSERYSVDFVGKDNGHNGSNSSSSGGSSSGGSNGSGGNMDEDKINKIRHKWRRSLREVFEHEPRELFISINGRLQGSQKILRNHNKQSVKIDSAEEPVQFVEVFSEQNVRLAFISLDEAAPGENQNCAVKLSDDRSLNLNLIRSGSETLVEVVYHDPAFEETEILLARELASNRTAAAFLPKENGAPEISLFSDLPESGKKRRLAAFAGRLKDKFFPAGFGLNPLTATAALAIFIILALAAGRFLVFVPEVSAGEILARAGNSEEIAETTADAIIHRKINLEERKSTGELLRKNKIETWTDAARKLSVRRLYDEKNQLIAGEWRRKDGVSTYYAPEQMPQLRRVPTDKEVVADAAESENIWRLSVSAKGFESLIETPEKAGVERRGDNYVISYQTGKNQGVVKAVLVLNGEMRASEQILTVRRDGEEREFRFTETNFERKPRETVENSVFEPGKELVKQSSILAANNRGIEKGETEQQQQQLQTESNQPVNAEKNSPAAAMAATQELEVKVLELLNDANALAGDQINIVKTPDGKLRIDGIVDARSRKDEILNALAPVRGNPALQVNILTAGEAALNKSGRRGAKTPGAIENVTVESRKSIPAGDALRNYFSGGGLPEDKIDSEIRRFASSVMAKSSQMRRAALSMKQIAERFSASELEKMDEPTRAQWRRLVRQNAANLLRQSEALKNELRPVFNNNSTGAGGNVNADDDAELIRTAKRLFDLSLAVDNDVRSSFSLSNGNSAAAAGGIPVKSGRFDNSLSEIINLSRRLR